MAKPYTLVPRDLFVVGDLFEKREKLSANPDFYQRELDVLTQVFPQMEDPIVTLGAHWIPPKVYQAWTLEEFGVQTRWFYSPTLAAWDVQVTNPPEIDNPTNSLVKGFVWIKDPAAAQEMGLAGGDLKVRYGTDQFNALAENDLLGCISAIDTGAKGKKGLIQLLLDRGTPKCQIVIRTPEGEQKQPCAASTNKALTRMRRLGKEFAQWCASSPHAAELKEIYNQYFNREADLNRHKQGEHLDLYGINPVWAERVRPYQKDIIASALLGNFLAGAEVGLGKTISGIASAMQRIHYRTATKALVVVQKSTLSDYEKTARALYPDARILVVSEKDCEAVNRSFFLGKVAFYPWDIVIMHHDMFDMLPFRREVEEHFQQEHLAQVKAEISWYESLGEVSKSKGKKTANRNLKKLEEERNRICARLSELAGKTDCGLHVEDLGFDYFVIDECDRYKSAYVKTRLKGINGVNCTSTSNRAMHFQLFCDWANQKWDENALLFLTGTPEPDNWIGGVFIYQRFLQPSRLKAKGIISFDAWATMFGEIETKMELKIAGSMALTTRFSKYRNVVILMKTWKQNAEMWRYHQVEDQIKEKRPTSEIVEVLCPQTPEQQHYMRFLASRLQLANKFEPLKFVKRNAKGEIYAASSRQALSEGKKNRTKILKHPVTQVPITSEQEAYELGLKPLLMADSWYSINHEGRCLMLAPQLLDPWLWERIGIEGKPPVDSEGKIAKCIDLVSSNYDPEQVQIIFCDTGVPNGSARFPIYQYIKAELVKCGIPSTRIGFIQTCKTKSDREKFFKDINDGKINVVIMSTQKGGIGVNIQKRAKYMYLLDVLQKPSWFEQRLGRIVRSGNMHSEVTIYQFLTVGGANKSASLDAFYSQMNQRKIASREQLWTCTKNEMMGDGIDQNLFLQHTASASGDEKLEEYSRLLLFLEEEEDKLTSLSQQAAFMQKSKSDGIPGLQIRLAHFQKEADICGDDSAKALAAIPGCTGEKWQIQIGDKTLNAKDADKELQQILSDWKLEFSMERKTIEGSRTIAVYGGFNVVVHLRAVFFNGDEPDWEVSSRLAGDSNYRFNWVVSRGKIITRLEETLITISEQKAKYDSFITKIQAEIDAAEKTVSRLKAEIPELRDRVQELEERKAVLEAELNFSSVS
jgi:flagellar biosynthesis chaperone FliJ